MPDAMPLLAGSTTRSAPAAIAGFATPMPTPQTTRPGRRTVQCAPVDTLSQQQQADCHDREARGEEQPERDAGDGPSRDEGHEEDERGDRQEAETGPERRVAVDVLQVDREKREQREHPGTDAERCELHPDERRLAEERNVEHRSLLPYLDHDECREQREARDERGEDLRARPADGIAAEQPEDDQEEGGGEADQPGHIGAGRRGVA